MLFLSELHAILLIKVQFKTGFLNNVHVHIIYVARAIPYPILSSEIYHISYQHMSLMNIFLTNTLLIVNGHTVKLCLMVSQRFIISICPSILINVSCSLRRYELILKNLHSHRPVCGINSQRCFLKDQTPDDTI